ncbi:MAG: AMP-binding protein, partial [Actinomadura rubrobrunea]|nr:AMP-binding protein [Actinomadura rubrobrunea]
MSDPFFDRLKLFGTKDAIVFNDIAVGYDRLLDMAETWWKRFDREDIGRGHVVALEASYSPASCAALLALIRRGAIVVPLGELPAAKRAEFHDIAEVETSVVIGRRDQDVEVTRTGRRAGHELYQRLREADSPGLVLFSSGTSGRSKASVLDFHRLLRRYPDTRRARRTLSFLNLDHIGGVNTLLHTLSQGGAVVTVNQRTPDAVFAAIERHRVQVLPTTPTFLNMVLVSGAHERYATDSLELITYGTEPMPLRTLQQLNAALPHVRFKQTYGLSELGILPTKSKSDETLWIKLGGAGFDYKIVDDVLWIRSDMAMLGYLNAPAPFDDEGYFNTQDVVETDGDYVRILGRRSEIINVGGEKVYPSEVENVLLDVPNIVDATVSGMASPITGMVVKATVRLARQEERRALT